MFRLPGGASGVNASANEGDRDEVLSLSRTRYAGGGHGNPSIVWRSPWTEVWQTIALDRKKSDIITFKWLSWAHSEIFTCYCAFCLQSFYLAFYNIYWHLLFGETLLAYSPLLFRHFNCSVAKLSIFIIVHLRSMSRKIQYLGFLGQSFYWLLFFPCTHAVLFSYAFLVVKYTHAKNYT